MVTFFGTTIYERVIEENSDDCNGRTQYGGERDFVESIGEYIYGREERRHRGIYECVSHTFVDHQAGHQSRYEDK